MFVIATMVQAMAHGAMAVCAGLIGQAVIGRQVVGGRALAAFARDEGTLSPSFLCSIGLVSAIVKATAGCLSTYGQKRASFRFGDSIRQELSDAILQNGREPGQASAAHAAIVVRMRDVERGIDEGFLAGVRAAAELMPLLVALAFLSSGLALAAIGVLSPFAAALAWARKYQRRRHARAARLAESLHAGLDELVRHVDLWRTFGAEARVRNVLAATGRAAGTAAARVEAARAAMSGSNEILAAAALLVVVVSMGPGSVRVGNAPLIAFAAVFFLTYRPLRDLGDARAHFDRGAEALAELEGLVKRDAAHTLSDPRARPAGYPAGEVPGSPSGSAAWGLGRLDVRDACAAWGTPASSASFVAEPGEIVAIVGPTGSGKTTLLRVLLGLEVGQGSIRYGGDEIATRGVGPDERPFAWVPQEPAIVTGTIEDNVALGSRSAGAEEARAALEGIGARSLLGARKSVALSAGGPELSGGERQWIAIARALASELPVLLLDEPTSGLDAEAQERVIGALEGLRGKRTIVLVTHRPEPLAIADRVIRLGSPERAAAAE